MFHIRDYFKQIFKGSNDYLDLISHVDPKSTQSEQFRNIRTNIDYATSGQDIKTLLISSSIPSEGKSHIASNLAYVMAQNKKKILLVDADLRRSTIHKLLKVENQIGLSQLLLNEDLNYHDHIVHVDGLDIDVITSGKIVHNPSELLASERMGQLISQMRDDYDMVIFDAPPVIAISDSLILAAKLDGIILVARYRFTKKDEFIMAKESLNSIDANILGYVLNALTDEAVHSSYYYSYGSS